MEYHQSIAAPSEPTLAALTQALGAHGYRLERSFDLRSTRHATALEHNQYLVLLAYEQAASAPPVAITLHECGGVTRLSVATLLPGVPLAGALLAAFDEAWDSILTD